MRMPEHLAAPDRQREPVDIGAKAAAPPLWVRTLSPPPAPRTAGRAASLPARTQIGHARRPDSPRSAEMFVRRLIWEPSGPGLQRTRIWVTSAGAAGLRVGLVVQSLPDDARLLVHEPGQTWRHAFTGRDVNRIVAANLAAGIPDDEARVWWAPLTRGDMQELIVELPTHQPVDGVQLAVASVSHIDRHPDDPPPPGTRGRGDALFCHVDAVCRPEWQLQRDAVLMLVFTRFGVTYQCTGTLLNPADGSFTPYVLTARHCIDQQAAASTLITHWFFQTSTCNGSADAPQYTTRTGGSTLLYVSAATDTSFLVLPYAPPAGAVFAGWWAGPPALGTPVAGIHHPRGDRKKISSGSVRNYANCTAIDPVTGQFTCVPPPPQTQPAFIDAHFTSGTMEAGTSGSALWAQMPAVQGGAPVVVGQFYGGQSGCGLGFQSGIRMYGRLDLAWSAGLSRFLSPGTADPAGAPVTVFEFYNRRLNRFFRTADANEVQYLRSTPAAGEEETGDTFIAFANGNPGPGSLPVCRFYGSVSPGPNSHFFTLNGQECEQLKALQASTPATAKRWNYEGIAFHAVPPTGGQCPAQAPRPVYRLYNNGWHWGIDSNHRFTTSAAVYSAMQAQGWIGEGIVMCVR